MNFKINTILSFICLFLGSCAVNKEYDKALQSNSIRAYQEYQQKFPKSKARYTFQFVTLERKDFEVLQCQLSTNIDRSTKIDLIS